MDMNRRQLFRFGAAAVLTAAIAPVASALAAPTLWGDGEHDDTEALQAMFDGKPFTVAGQKIIAKDGTLVGGSYRISKAITIQRSDVSIRRAEFWYPGGDYIFRIDGTAQPVANVLISHCDFDMRLVRPEGSIAIA